MNDIKNAIQQYFIRLFHSIKDIDEGYPSVVLAADTKNQMIVSKCADTHDWYNWIPVEKTETTDFGILEAKYSVKFHQSIKDYYNQYWFYKIYGKMYIDNHMGEDVFELEKVVPGEEIKDLEAHIDRYYCGGNILNFSMVPIGLVQNLFVVIDNKTGEVFVDDRLEFGIFRLVSATLPEFINKLNTNLR